MKRFINLICCITITCLLLSCSDDTSSERNPLSMIEQSSSENVFLSSSSDENDDSSSSESIVLSSSVIESSSSIKHQVEGNSSDGIVDSSSSESMVSSSSAIESSSSIKHQVENSSSDGIDDSSSSESMVSSSSVMEYSSSDMILGKCKTSTEDKCVYGELYDVRDGKTYKTVFMGTQEWMAENLNYSDSVASPNLQGGSWCYNNDDSNCDKYGRLYSWYAAMDIPKESCSTNTTSCPIYHNHRGICPNGWHLPDTTDFAELLKYVKRYSPTKYGYDLVATSETNGSNAFGYSILYGGYYYNIITNPNFNGIGVFTYLWTSTLVTDRLSEEIRAYMILFHGQDVYNTASYGKVGKSVRCIKDN